MTPARLARENGAAPGTPPSAGAWGHAETPPVEALGGSEGFTGSSEKLNQVLNSKPLQLAHAM